MPRVHALLGPAFNGQHDRDVFAIAEEIIPLYLNTAQGPLNPGSILWSHKHVDYGLEGYDLLVEIEAQPFEDRVTNVDDIKHQLQAGFTALLPSLKPLVYLKFIEGHWGLDDVAVFDEVIDRSPQATMTRVNRKLDREWIKHLNTLEAARSIVGN